MFIFGANVKEVGEFTAQLHAGRKDYIGSRLKRVFDCIRGGMFGDVSIVHGVLDGL